MADALTVNTRSGKTERRPLTDEEKTQRQTDAQAEADRQSAEDARAAAAEKLKTASSVADLQSALVTLFGIK